MKTINLTQGYEAMVDDDDYEKLNKEKWCVSRTGYACRNVRENGKRKTILMHREIMGISSGLHTDHIDHNRLNNQKCNLRPCMPIDNQANQSLYSTNTSGYKGVYFNKKAKKWYAQITRNKRCYYIGTFSNPIDAAEAYNNKATEMFGDFASLNIIRKEMR